MLAIAKLTLRAALASPGWMLLIALLGALLALAPRLTFFALGETGRIVRDTGESTLRLAGLLLALGFGLPAEGDRALDDSLLARPITATGLILGRFLGAATIALGALAMLSVVHYGTLKWARLDSGPVTGAAGRAAVEALGLVALASALGAALPRGPAAVLLIVVFALAHTGAGAAAVVLPGGGAPLPALLAAAAALLGAAAVAETREAGAAS